MALTEEVVDPLGGRTYVEGMGYWGLSSGLASVYSILLGFPRWDVNKRLIFLLPWAQAAPDAVPILPRRAVCTQSMR